MGFSSVANAALAELDRRAKAESYVNDPVAWCQDYLGVYPWRAQREILESIRDNRQTAVAAGHGVGKSYIASVAICWWADTHPPDRTFIATTAPSVPQLGIVWDEIRKIHGRAAQRFKEGLVDHPLPGYITGDNKWKLDNGVILGEGRKPPEQASDTHFQGRHADYLFAVGDEAVGLSEGFINALGVIATGQWNRQLLQANPTDPTSKLAQIWRNDDSTWNKIQISVKDSPRLKPEPGYDVDKYAPGLSGQEFIDWALEEYGSEDDPRYISRVNGEWAFDSGNNVFLETDLASARNTCVVPDTTLRPEIGADIARSATGDWSQVYLMERGQVWTTDPVTGNRLEKTDKVGMRVRMVDRWRGAPLTGEDPKNKSTTRRIHEHALNHGAIIVKPDAAGLGAGVIDGLKEIHRREGQAYVVFEMFGGATNNVDTRAYINIRAQQFFEMQKMMRAGKLDLDPADEQLFNDLAGIQYQNDPKGRIKIESKDDIRKSGRKSPDAADAVWYATYDVIAEMEDVQPGQRVVFEAATVIKDEFSAEGEGLPFMY